jgi:hypothetical protein
MIAAASAERSIKLDTNAHRLACFVGVGAPVAILMSVRKDSTLPWRLARSAYSPAQQSQAQTDPLPSWNDGAAGLASAWRELAVGHRARHTLARSCCRADHHLHAPLTPEAKSLAASW